jgi:hypothetical protein
MFTNQILYWFSIYLAVGLPVLVLLRLLGARRTKLQPAGEMYRAIMADLRSKESRRVRWSRFAQEILMYPLVLVIWPVVLVMLILDMYFSSKDHWTPDPEGAFNCRRQHLERVVSPEAAEVEAKVVDPLGRVPDLPFGHLNVGWHALLADRQIGDTLWYFEVPGYTPGPDESTQGHQWSVPRGAKRGYALVQSRKVRNEFVFEWD